MLGAIESREPQEISEVAGGERDHRPVRAARDRDRIELHLSREHHRGDHRDDANEDDDGPPRGTLSWRRDAGCAEILSRVVELDQAEQHADCGQREADVPAEFCCNDRDEKRAEERTEVDAHVEDREPGIAPRATLRVELRDDGADVGLQQAHAAYDHDQADEEQARVPDREAGIPDHDEDAAAENRFLLSQQPVRDPAAEQAQQVRA